MKVGVVGDSHDRVPMLRAALEAFRKAGVGAILHAGDIIAPFAAKLLADAELTGGVPVHCVFGNNDGERAGVKEILPQISAGPVRLVLGGRTVVMHHRLDQLSPADLAGAELVVTGHTHAVARERRGRTLYLNSGECCGWLTGECTAAIVDLTDLSAEIIRLGT